MSRICGAVGMTLPPGAALVVVVAGRLTPGYDPVSRTISRLAVPGMPADAMVDVAIILVAITCLVLAINLNVGSMAGRAGLVVAGMALAATALIHLDPSSETATALHRVASGLAVAGLTAAPFLLARTYGRMSVGVGVAEIAMLGLAFVLLSTSFSAWGAWERITLAIPLGWMVLLSARAFMSDSSDAIAIPAAATVNSTGS